MTEDIITGLSCDSRLFVVSINPTFVYKGKPVDTRTVGKELGMRYVLEGSIRPMGDRLRINVQLIETASGMHVWADQIDRPQQPAWDMALRAVCWVVWLGNGKNHCRRPTSGIPSRKAMSRPGGTDSALP